MRAEYALVRELKPYSLAEVADRLSCDQSQTQEILGRLLASGVVRYRTRCDQDEFEVADAAGAADDECYQFRYVGIVIVGRVVIVCYPKYIRRDGGPTETELQQMVRVLRRLDGYGELPHPQGDAAWSDELSVIVRLLQLYDERGIYSNFEEIRELNGNGVIDWGRTVDTVTPVLADGVPVYLDYWTRKTRRDDTDLVTRIHRAILTECSRFLSRSGIAELLGFGDIELTEETPANLGDPEVLDWRLERERSMQFVTWKQEAIDLMRLYLGGGGVASVREKVFCLGTTAYYHAWELACKRAFGDLLDTKLGNLPLELADNWRNRASDTMLDIIPRPLWERPERMGECGDVATLIPDTVTFARDSNGKSVFCIYDAKYYVPTTNGKMEGQPGVESVSKQFLYQSAYKAFVLDHDFDRVSNTFLIPSEDADPAFIARVSFPGVLDALAGDAPQFSRYVDMWALPASAIFECYLSSTHLDAMTVSLLTAPSRHCLRRPHETSH